MEGIVRVRTHYDKVSEKRLKRRLGRFLLILSMIILAGILTGVIFGERVLWIAMLPVVLSFFLMMFIGSMFLMVWLRKAMFPKSAVYILSNEIIRIEHFRFGEYDIPIRNITRIAKLADDVNYKVWKMDSSGRNELKLPAEGFLNPYRVEVSKWMGSNSESTTKTWVVRFNSFMIGDDEDRTGYTTLIALLRERRGKN